MLHLSRKKRYLFSVLSGILMFIAFPYTGSLYPLMFFAFVPLLLLEEHITKSNYRSRKVFLHAYIAFFIYNLGATWWIWNASAGGALLAFFLNSFLMALVFQFFHFTKKNVGRKEAYLALPIYWLSFEYIHYHWDLSWPWLNLGNIFSIQPEIVQWYSISGVLGGTFWILIVNILIFKIIQNVYFKKETWKIQTPLFYVLTFILFFPIIYSVYKYSSFSEKSNPIEVVVVQPNIDPYNVKFNTPVQDQINKIIDLASDKKTSATAFVLAPETAISAGFYEDQFQNIQEFQTLTNTVNSWQNTALLIGASTYKSFPKKNSIASRPLPNGNGFYESYNTSMLLEPSENTRFWHKSKLVLGVEKIPFTNWLPFLETLAIDLDGGSGTLGIETSPPVGMTKNTTFAPIICYESIYGEFVAEQGRKGAEVLFVITNDGWWGDTPGYKQHMSFARLRAIENRRSVARSANTGKSCFINQRGDVLQASEWWEEDALKAVLNKNNTVTTYMKYGDVLGRTFSFVSIMLIIFTSVKFFGRTFNVNKHKV